MDLALDKLQWLICHKAKQNANPSGLRVKQICQKNIIYGLLVIDQTDLPELISLNVKYYWMLQVQSRLKASNSTGILNTCTRLWLTESEQVTPEDSIKDVVRSSVKIPKFDKHLKKPGGHIGRNVVEMRIKMKTIVQKPLMIKIICLLFSDQLYLHCFAQQLFLFVSVVRLQSRELLTNTFLN